MSDYYCDECGEKLKVRERGVVDTNVFIVPCAKCLSQWEDDGYARGEYDGEAGGYERGFEDGYEEALDEKEESDPRNDIPLDRGAREPMKDHLDGRTWDEVPEVIRQSKDR